MRPITKRFGLGLASMAFGTVLALAEGAAPTAAAPGTPAATPNATPAVTGAKITFETPTYDFGRAKSGEPIKHTFIFTNIGCETLEINNVRPGCGCTTAGEWTKKVEPGKTGSIPIQVNTANFNGPIMKNVSVDSNDKAAPTTVLYLKGTIWKPVDLNPQFAMINVPPDTESGSTVLRIVNNMEEPLTLSAPEVNNPGFKATLNTKQPGKEYELVVSTVPGLKTGYTQSQITLKTSSTNLPTLTANVGANVQAAVTVVPQQITLPPGPLANQTMPQITIQNNSTNALTLLDAETTAKDVQVKKNEANPGRLFTITLTFPQGYELPVGEHAEFTVKTSNPQFALIRVPITQMPHPATPVPAKANSGIQVGPARAAHIAGSSGPLQPLPLKGQ